MKRITIFVLIIFICFFLFLNAFFDNYEKEKQFIVDLEKEITKNDIFDFLKIWINKNFHDSFNVTTGRALVKTRRGLFRTRNVLYETYPIDNFSGYSILEENKEKGIIFIKIKKKKVVLQYNLTALDMNCKIDIKNNKFKVVFSEIEICLVSAENGLLMFTGFLPLHRNEKKRKIQESELRMHYNAFFESLIDDLKKAFKDESNW